MLFKAFSRDFKSNKISLIKSKRSQSALEYMMTYGWAILIIVIVAVILYSMGIFNPSSSVTFTSSGFTPFTISSVICSQDSLSFSVLAGPVPNGAYSMSIDKFYIVSSSGTNASRISYTLPNPITLTSGKTVVIAVPNVICPSAGTKVSMSANLEYSYSTTAGKVVTNTTGTLAGTATRGPTLPSGIEYYSQITISNSQLSATPSPFQQMVNFTSSDPGWTSISTSNFGQNVEFFYYNGTVIPSWLESYSSSNAIWWLKIAAIPAGSSETVYVGFAPSTTNLFNTVNDGEAPQLSSAYAEYDDGAGVFELYSNFKGTSLNTNKWINGGTGTNCGGTVVSGGGTGATVNNGLSISTNSGTYWGGIVSSAGFTPPVIFETDTISVSGVASGIAEATANNLNAGMYFFNFWDSGFASGTIDDGLNNLAPPLISTGITGIAWLSSSSQVVYHNYIATPESQTVYSLPSTVYLTIGLGDCSPSSDISVQWARVRAYPPKGVMPSVSFGSIA